jgi:hypothetical protein
MYQRILVATTKGVATKAQVVKSDVVSDTLHVLPHAPIPVSILK